MKILISLFAVLFTFAVQARDGSSGCGPGWYVMQDNSLVSSALRATTNGFLFPTVTIGMTLGTSNCTRHKLVLKEKEAIHFATHNAYELMREAAQGQGEFLAAFYTTLGCVDSQNTHFSQLMKTHFQDLFKDLKVQPEDIVLETYKVILNDQALTLSCSLG